MPEPQDPITTGPPPIEPPPKPRDPGSRFSRTLATVLAAALFLATALLQAWPEPEPETTPQEPVGIESVNLQADMAFRMVIKLSDLFASDPKSAEVLATWARTPQEKVYLAIALAEVEGPRSALDRLEPACEQAAAEELRADIAIFQRLYAAAEATPDGGEAPVSPEEREGLVARHGYYAQIALTYDLPRDDPARRELRRGAGGILLMVVGAFVIVGAIAAGFALFVVAVVLLALRRVRPTFVGPEAGGSVFLETFALFVGLFLAIKLSALGVVALIGPEQSGWVIYATMGAQWILLITPLWPLARGMNLSEWRQAIGLHTGRGLFREMGSGVFAYLAALPLYLLAILAVIALLAIREWVLGGPQAPPSNPMIELVEKADPLLQTLFFLMATIWAPLCEELIFRGAVYRHLRAYFPAIVAGLISGVLFAFMHNYGPLMTPPLIMLGLVFCMMREWRGSLVASMTAHALHNGTLLLLLFSLIRALG
ncbi:MAG: CPBP family intramembrane metalloprotease [Phycisphaerales bacterium]|nr:CPBP family intramembrane metalloprotease [Phycisphaerales bacterium]